MKKLLKLKFIIPAIVAIAAGITLPIVLIPHTHKVVDETWLNDATNHWHACSNCDEFVDLAEHEFGEWENVTGKCQKAQACITCGYVVTEDVAHTYDDACDETCNVCGTERSTDHKYGTLVAKVDPTCEEEGLHAHYKCSDCNSYFDETKKEVTYSSLVINALGHTCGELVAEVAADCINTGFKAHYKCAACEQYFDAENNKVTYDSLVIAAEGHYLSNVPANPATCVTDGTIAHKHCSVCEKNFDADGNELTSVVVTAPGHKLGTLVAEKPATCGEAGLKAHYKCTECEKYFDAEKNEVTYESLIIAAKTHTYSELITEIKSTCLATGTKAHYECLNCEALFNTDKEEVKAEDLIIAIGDHVYGELIAEKAAKCETTGLEAHYKCSVCEKLFQDVEEVKTLVTLEEITIHAIGHEYNEPSYSWNEDYTKCTATKVCVNDATHYISETIDATYEVTVEPTEDTNGEGVYTTAEFEDEDFEVQTHKVVIYATKHNYTSEPTYEWNEDYTKCTATVKCSDEGCDEELTETSTVTPQRIEPTCENKGSITYSHVFTNSLFKPQTHVEEIDALGHAFGAVEYTWNSDYTEVIATRVCANDDTHVETATSTNITSITVDAECEKAGKTTYTVVFENTVFGTDTKEVVIEALEHENGTPTYAWSVDNSTCTATVKCSVCNELIDQQTVESTYTTTATCTEAGVATFTVTFEGEVFETQVKEGEPQEALGHDFEEVAAEAPTCTEDGSLAHLHCKVCEKNFNADEEELESVLVEKIGHDYKVSNDKLYCNNEGCTSSFTHYYLRGTFNNWASVAEYRLDVNPETKKATLLLEIFEEEELKICVFEGWADNTTFGANKITHSSTDFSGAGTANLKALAGGVFLVTADYTGKTVKFSIEKVEHTHTKAENAEMIISDEVHYFECSTCFRGTIDYAKHDFVTSKACQTKCTVCGYERTTTVAHTYDHGCDADCNVCSETRSISGHNYGTKVEKVAATCTEDGHITYYQCSVCNQYFDGSHNVVISIVIEKLGHDFAKAWTNTDEEGHYHVCTRTNCGAKDEVKPHIPGAAATETTPQTCTVCEKVLTPALGHECNFTEVADTKYIKTKATCVAKAVYYKSCSCGKTSEDTFEGSEFGNHDLDEIEAEAPNCTETGLLAHEKCTLCGQLILNDKEVELKDVTISANGHDKELEHHAAESATCTQTGKLEYWSCNSCETKFKENSSTEENIITDITAPAKGHTLTYGTDIKKEIHDNKEIDIHFDYAKCTECNAKQNVYYIKGNFLPTQWDDSIEGRFDSDLTKGHATITLNLKVGDTFKVGTTDGWEFTSETMTGWNNDFIKLTEGMDWANLKCKNAGLYTITISGLLKGQTKSAAISKYTGEHTTHTYSEELFHNDTEHWNYCLVCRSINNEDHKLGEIIPEQPSTCTETGLAAHYLCECGQYFDTAKAAVEKESLVTAPKHTLVDVEEVAATCTETGTEAHKKCTVCELLFKGDQQVDLEDLVIEKIDHEYETVVTKPTCTEGGFTTYTCECGDTYTSNAVPATGHSHEAVVTAPTCTQKGYTTYTCHCGNTYTGDNVPATGHSHEAVVTAPTCTQDGYTTYTCHCGDTYTGNEVPATGHDYDAVVTAPTCTVKGYTTYTCHCGDTYTDNETEVISHTEVIIPAVAASCIATGLTEGKQCSVCKTITVAQQTVNKLDHTEVIDKAVAATCMQDGKTEGKHCSACNTVLVAQQTVKASGHTEEELAAVPATCTQPGKTAGKKCSVCDEILVAQTNTNPLDHNYGDFVSDNSETHTKVCKNDSTHKVTEQHNIIWDEEYENQNSQRPTELEKGTMYGECSCGYTTSKEVAATHTEHIYSEEFSIDKAATCTEVGSKSRHCTTENCPSKTDVTVIPANNHSYGEIEYNWNDDYSQVSARRECENCDHYEYDEVSEINYSVINEASCSKEGLVRYTSKAFTNTAFDAQTIDVVISKLAHTEEIIPAVAPDCTNTGSTEGKKCSVCNEVLDAPEEVAAKGHTEVIDAAIAARCTTAGKTEGKHCSVCSTVLIAQEEVPATGHTCETWNEEIPATCKADGTKGHYVCDACELYIDKDKTTIITSLTLNQLTHEYGVWDVTNAPTSETTGLLTKSCTLDNCDDSVTFELPVLNTTNYPTYEDVYTNCLEEGTRTYSYSKDGQTFTFTATIDPLQSHNYSDGDVTPPTCTKDGYTTYTCSECNHSYSDNKIDSLGHAYSYTNNLWDKNTMTTVTFTCQHDSTHIITENVEYSTINIIETSTCVKKGKGTYESAIVNCNVEIEMYMGDHNYKNPVSNNNGTHTLTCTHDKNHTNNEDCTHTSNGSIITYNCECGYEKVKLVIWYLNSENWSKVNCYSWDSSKSPNNLLSGSWPGSSMTLSSEKWYYYEYTVNSLEELGNMMIIFNNGSGRQTADITVVLDEAKTHFYSTITTGFISKDECIKDSNLPKNSGIFLAGSMNGWDTTKNEFKVYENCGKVRLNLSLSSGTYTFKLVVNNKWSGGSGTISNTVANKSITIDGGNNITWNVSGGNYLLEFDCVNNKLTITTV